MLKREYNEMESKEFNKAMSQGKLTPAHDGIYWTDEERYQLKELFQQGEDISKISRILQRTEQAIMQQLSSLKLFETPSKRNKKKIAKCLCNKCVRECPCHDCKNMCEHCRKN